MQLVVALIELNLSFDDLDDELDRRLDLLGHAEHEVKERLVSGHNAHLRLFNLLRQGLDEGTLVAATRPLTLKSTIR